MLHDFPALIERQAEPSYLDKAPYGVICKLKDKEIYYRQESKDEENPRWLEIDKPLHITGN